jgi:hypothetical protein
LIFTPTSQQPAATTSAHVTEVLSSSCLSLWLAQERCHPTSDVHTSKLPHITPVSYHVTQDIQASKLFHSRPFFGHVTQAQFTHITRTPPPWRLSHCLTSQTRPSRPVCSRMSKTLPSFASNCSKATRTLNTLSSMLPF